MTASSEKAVGQYIVLSKLGQGGFGVIFRVRSLSKYSFVKACIMYRFVVVTLLMSYFYKVDNNIYVMKEIPFEDSLSMETAL